MSCDKSFSIGMAILIYFIIIVSCVVFGVYGINNDATEVKWWVFPCFIIGFITFACTPHAIFLLYDIINKLLKDNK